MMAPTPIPSFTVLVGTIGRPSISNLVHSFVNQVHNSNDQLVLAIDGFERPEADIDRVNAAVEAHDGFHNGVVTLIYDAGYHHLGVPQINWAWRFGIIEMGSHILTIGDDDVFVPGAFAKLRAKCEASPDRPILYRFVAPWREILWDREGVLERGRISGCCLAAPVHFNAPHPTDPEAAEPDPTHDFDWIKGVVGRAKAAGYDPVWWNEVLVVARPDIYPVEME